MLFGIAFLLNPPPVAATGWKVPEWLGHAVHNHSMLHLLEKAFHCTYYGLLFADSMFGTKSYYWTALPILIILLVTFRSNPQ